jgi:hypothetical protein
MRKTPGFDRNEINAWIKIRNLTLVTVLAVAIEKPFYGHLPMGSQPKTTAEVLIVLHNSDERHFSAANNYPGELLFIIV